MGPRGSSPRPARRGLVEYLVVLAILALAATGAATLFGDRIRAFFGVPPEAAAREAPARGGP